MTEPIGLSSYTPQYIQLNAGMFIMNFDYSTATDADSLATLIEAQYAARTNILGATNGGGTFTAKPEIRKIEADGMRYDAKGMKVIDSWEISLSTTMKELFSDNVKRALITGDKVVNGRKETITLRTAIQDSDYIDKLCWVGLMGDGSYMVIELQNVLNEDGMSLTFKDKGEGEIKVNFKASHASITDQDSAPCKITYFHSSSTASHITVYSVEGTTSGKTMVTITPQDATSAQSYKYKAAATVTLPAADDVLSTGWETFTNGSEITVTDGYEIVVAKVTTADNKCVAAGKTIVVAKA